MNDQINIEGEVVCFSVKRIRHHSRLSFDQVLGRLRSRVGQMRLEEFIGLSETPGTSEEFEENIQPYIGKSGFMLFSQIDHGRWTRKFGIKRRLIRWIFGNPLIAITMLRHDYTAGLFVPIELLLAESDDGTSCNITYVLPSSLIALDENPELLAAAQALDAKAEALAVSAVTCDIDFMSDLSSSGTPEAVPFG